MTHLDEMLEIAANKAMAEIAHTTLEEIQWATAITWAGRSLAAYTVYAETGDVNMLLEAEEFGHEAIEHAALAGPGKSDEIALRVNAAKARALG